MGHLFSYMEMLLNTICVLVSLAIAGWCWKHRSVSAASGRHFWQYLVALALISVILFPAISATDDLNSAMLATEDSGFSEFRSAHALLIPAALDISALLLPASFIAHRSAAGRVSEERPAAVQDVVISAAAGRAPPSLAF